MKVGVQVEIDLSTIDSGVLVKELESRGVDFLKKQLNLNISLPQNISAAEMKDVISAALKKYCYSL